MKKLPLSALFAVLLLLNSCGSSSEDATIVKIKDIYGGVKSVLAPDGRSKVFEVNVDKIGGDYVLRGATNDANCKDSLLEALSANNVAVLDSIRLLPSADLGDKLYGVTAQSVINFRTRGSYSAESATQTMMGTPVRILEKRDGWTRAITPEGYIAWVSSPSLAYMDEAEFRAYQDADKVVVTDKYITMYEKPSASSQMVSDAVWGNILLDLGNVGAWKKVAIADGREGYVPRSSVQDFDTWLKQRNPTADNIIKTAKQFIGVPYMWGGTSIKAVDCSGFTKSTYYLNGLILARDASQQCYTGDDVDIKQYTDGEYTLDALKNLKKGDLIFFGSKATPEKKERITHVGIYIEDGIFIHSAGKVRINSLIPDADNYYTGSVRLVRAQRILGNQDCGKGIVSMNTIYE